jgi:hypothetical protein
MIPDEQATKAVLALKPDMEKAFKAVNDFGIKCFALGVRLAQENEGAHEKLEHPDNEKNRSL